MNLPHDTPSDVPAPVLSGVEADQEAVAEGAIDAPAFAVPELVRYQRALVVGRGGMGQVSEVLDTRLGRHVALKEVPPDAAARPVLERRLVREAWVTARLDHPGIVPVHDAGLDPAGRPFFTMRLIRGRSLAAALAEPSPDTPALLRHFLAACQAVAHAHARGVVHRDLKPANIMLGPFGETQVVDWGVARVLGQAEAAEHDLDLPAHGATRVGGRIGTLAWMSPEQSRGEEAGPPSDVYALGLILGAIAGTQTGPPDPELQAILARAAATETGARYQDAAALAADVEAFLDGRRVAAFTYTPMDLARRFYRTFRGRIFTALAVLVAVAIGFAVLLSATRAERDRAQRAEQQTALERDRSEAAERSAQDALATAREANHLLLVDRAEAALRAGALAEAELLASHAAAMASSPRAAAVLARTAATPRARLVAASWPPVDCVRRALARGARSLACAGPETLSLWQAAAAGQPWQRVWELPGATDEMAWLGERWLLASVGGQVVRVDVATGVPLPVPAGVLATRAIGAGEQAISDDGVRLLALSSADGADARPVFDAPTRQPWALSADGRYALTFDPSGLVPHLIDLNHVQVKSLSYDFLGDGPMSAALDHEGRHVAFGTARGRVLIGTIGADGSLRLQIVAERGRPVVEVAFSPDGRWLATRDERGFVVLIATGGGQEVPLPRLSASALAWRSGAEPRLVTLGAELLVWAPPVPEAGVSILRVDAGVAAMDVTGAADGADGATAHVALADGDGVVTVASLAAGGAMVTFQGGRGDVARDVAFLDREGRELVAIWPGAFRTAHLDTIGGGAERPWSSMMNFQGVVALSDGTVVAITYGQTVYRFAGGAPAPGIVDVGGALLVDLARSADRRRFAVLARGGSVAFGEASDRTDAPLKVVPYAMAAARWVALDATGAHVALASPGEVRVFSTANERVTASIDLADAGALVPSALALAPDASRVAVGGRDGRVLVWDVATGRLTHEGREHARRVSSLAFVDADELLSASWDGTARRARLGLAPEPVDAIERAHGFGLPHAMRADLQ